MIYPTVKPMANTNLLQTTLIKTEQIDILQSLEEIKKKTNWNDVLKTKSY